MTCETQKKIAERIASFKRGAKRHNRVQDWTRASTEVGKHNQHIASCPECRRQNVETATLEGSDSPFCAECDKPLTPSEIQHYHCFCEKCERRRHAELQADMRRTEPKKKPAPKNTQKRQRYMEVLQFIVMFQQREFWPPTYAEISQHFGWVSSTAAYDHVKTLVRRGFLEQVPGRSRSIRPTPEGWAALQAGDGHGLREDQ